MHVVFDDQIFSMHRRGGISRYFTQLLQEFSSVDDLRVSTPFKYVVNEHLKEAFPDRYHMIPKPGRVPVRPVLDLLNSPGRRSAAKADIVHHTYYRASHLGTYTASRQVCTVHDMIPELFPEFFPRGNPHQDKQMFTDQCDAIVCVSETTKKDLLRIYGDLDKPIAVTYLGADRIFFDPPRTDWGFDHPYVLYVGARKGYKNFGLLAEAFSRLTTPRKLHLLCVGGGRFTTSESELFETLGISQHVVQLSPSDTELPTVYKQASVLCFPSRYEGFGLPLVEAFAVGCPVVVADTPCLVEISGGAADVVDPDSPDHLAQSLEKILNDPATADSLRVQGRLRAADFTWEATARRTIHAYEMSMQDSRSSI